MLSTLIFVCCLTLSFSATSNDEMSALGKMVFFDPKLSTPVGQSCASCHKPDKGYADNQIVAAGANPILFGNRNVPSISYVSFTPKWHFNSEDGTWIGGFFWDGRSLTLHEQAAGPLLSPLEMGNQTKSDVVNKVKKAAYAPHFTKLFGADIWTDSNRAFEAILETLVKFQSSKAFAPRFSSKYDAYLRKKVELSSQEKRGLKIFEDEDKGNCAACHPSQINEQGEWPLFTDFSYDNLGVPRLLSSPFLNMEERYNPAGKNYIDNGLADNPNIQTPTIQRGKFKVPTLRNIALTAPYMHNGVVTTLFEVLEYYNSRDVDSKWGSPEVAENVNNEELGDLKLTTQDIEDLEAFLNTLTDDWQAAS
ncbi:cytochrome-c peroxidase [Aliiglaciecola lipolytica]|nr:cytochrome c peroxidase [Aliiglaciecola lipolytica]